jgi:hypothetical protein
MTYLLNRAHRDVNMRPMHAEHIDFVYNFKETLKPNLEEIMYHQVPLCFKFSFLRSIGKAIMQYKLFSTQKYYWLPIPADGDIILSGPLSQLSVPASPTVGGWGEFLRTQRGDGRSIATRLQHDFAAAENEAQINYMSDYLDEDLSLSQNAVPAQDDSIAENRGVICLLKVKSMFAIY